MALISLYIKRRKRGGALIDLFTDTAAILNLLVLRSIMGFPGGTRSASLSIYAHFSGIKRTSLYISRVKRNHYYVQTRHDDLFFP